MENDDDDDDVERRNAELDFVSAAYGPEEAWSDVDSAAADGITSIHRRLLLPSTTASSNNNDDDHDDEASSSISILLTLRMPLGYPSQSSLEVSATASTTVNDEVSPPSGSMHNRRKKALWNALPHFLDACRHEADALVGQEAVLSVLSFADEWIRNEWPNYHTTMSQLPPDEEVPTTIPLRQSSNNDASGSSRSRSMLLGRRLIYSHHLISKVKRSNIRDLCRHYDLTGYIKIGWPGLIVIEGLEEHCNELYDDIRRWSWKYLVVRGEQQVPIGEKRKFTSLVETSDMSIVAQHCRQVGLEALFRTSMKVYDKDQADDDDDDDKHGAVQLWGTLVLVDHMNNPKMYRKWLRKTSRQLDCLLFVRQCYLAHTKKPIIFVGIVGTSVFEFMKRWRTSRVDLDSTGRPCLERQMSVIIDGTIDSSRVEHVEWDKVQDEDHVNVSLEKLQDFVDCVGGTPWRKAFDECLQSLR